jgi:hypothetical protein
LSIVFLVVFVISENPFKNQGRMHRVDGVDATFENKAFCTFSIDLDDIRFVAMRSDKIISSLSFHQATLNAFAETFFVSESGDDAGRLGRCRRCEIDGTMADGVRHCFAIRQNVSQRFIFARMASSRK